MIYLNIFIVICNENTVVAIPPIPAIIPIGVKGITANLTKLAVILSWILFKVIGFVLGKGIFGDRLSAEGIGMFSKKAH